MMTFPNAYEGVKKIYKSQILSLIGMGLMVLVAIFAAIMVASRDTAAIAVLGILALVVSLAALVFVIIGLVQYIQGINRAKIDEPLFGKALICAIVSLAFAVVIAFLSSKPTLKSILQILQNIANIAATYFIITGIQSLAKQLNRDDIIGYGKVTLYLLLGVFVLTVIANILSAFIVTSGVIAIIASILSIAQIVLYLIFLKKSVSMLEA